MRKAIRSWAREICFVLLFYGLYSLARNLQGSASVSTSRALNNARRVIGAEKFFGVYHELGIQSFFVDHRRFISFWDDFYGTAHFFVTIGVLIWLFKYAGARYQLWRNILAATTGLALIGFATFPLMPPRLLPVSYGFVDTLRTIGGVWSFDSGVVANVSNQFAAMPSLHFAWSTWCVLAIGPCIDQVWVRRLIWIYPAITLFAIVVTANHYFADAAGGAVTLFAGYIVGCAFTAWRTHPSLSDPSPPATQLPLERSAI